MNSYHYSYSHYQAQKIPGATSINQKIFRRLLASVLGYDNITKAAAINNPAPFFSGFEFSAEKIKTLSVVVPVLYDLVYEKKQALLSDRTTFSSTTANPMINSEASAPPMPEKMERTQTTLGESLLTEHERHETQQVEAVLVELPVIDTSNHDYLLKVLSVYMAVVDPDSRRSSFYHKPDKDEGSCCDGPCYCDCSPSSRNTGSDFWFYMWLWGPSPHSSNSAGACDGCSEGCESCGKGCENLGRGLGHALTSCGNAIQSTTECATSSVSNVVTGSLECVLSIFMDSIKAIMSCGGDICGLIGNFCGEFFKCCGQCCSGGGSSNNDCGELGGFGLVAIGGGGAAAVGATAAASDDDDSSADDDANSQLATRLYGSYMHTSEPDNDGNNPTHSHGAKIAIIVLLAAVCVALLPSIIADFRRCIDDLSHGRSMSQNVTKLALGFAAVVGTVMCVEFAGYDLLTDLVWGTCALYAFNTVYNTWILDNRHFGQSFTLDCKTFNQLADNAKTDPTHIFDAKTFMSNLGQVLADGQAEYKAQSKPAEDAPFYKRWAYKGWRGAFYGPVHCDNLDKIYSGDVTFAQSLNAPRECVL